MTKTTFLFTAALAFFWSMPTFSNETMVHEASGIAFVRIPAGCFKMGADAPGEAIAGLPIRAPGLDEVPRHEVCVGDFWLGKSEVTRGQWTKVMQTLMPGIDSPVSDVSWLAAMKFIAQLNVGEPGKFRLPTEAEWEYACHAGTVVPPTQPRGEERFALLADTLQVAWYRHESGRDPVSHPVMAKKPNAWGLHDMLGNLWEWTADGYDEAAYGKHARQNPLNLSTDDRKTIRGGSYKSDLAQVRCGSRSYAPAEDRSPVFGFRVVREIDPAKK